MEPEPQVIRLTAERFDEVVETLCDAFHDYPVMRYVLQEAGSDYDAQLASLIAYLTDSRFSRSWPVLGLEWERRLVAAASINPPRPAPHPQALQRRYEQLRQELGPRAIARFEAFTRSGEPFEPPEPHYYLGMIGVRGDSQGRGYARPLLDAVHGMSAADPESTGVLLTTETPDNLSLYEHFGYRVVGHAKVEDLESWSLFRPDAG